MSAETLRAAARLMRKDQTFEHALGHTDDRERDTWLAVADWLDATADGLDARGVTARVRPDERAALTVARAYLGETS